VVGVLVGGLMLLRANFSTRFINGHDIILIGITMPTAKRLRGIGPEPSSHRNMPSRTGIMEVLPQLPFRVKAQAGLVKQNTGKGHAKEKRECCDQ
jgi:hypothetical protein